MNVNLEAQAITFFASEVRSKIIENDHDPMPKNWISEILNEASTEIAGYLRKQYSPAPIANFLAVHPTVFLVSDDGPNSTVDVVSTRLTSCYVNYFICKTLESERVGQQTETDKFAEEQAILHFSRQLRRLPPAYQGRKKLDVLPKGMLNNLLTDYPTDIRNFVERKYASRSALECVEKFIEAHKKIFPQSYSRESVYVPSSEEVLKYIEELRSWQLKSADEDGPSESPKQDEDSDTSDEEPLSLEEQEAVLFFTRKMQEYKEDMSQDCTPISSLQEWYEECLDVWDTVLQRFGGCFEEFLENHEEVFWENDTENAQYETVSEDALDNYLNQFEINGYITEHEKSAVYALWYCFDGQNHASYSSLRDFYEACCDVQTATEDYACVEEFLDDHDDIFRKSQNGNSYRLASVEEIGAYLFD